MIINFNLIINLFIYINFYKIYDFYLKFIYVKEIYEMKINFKFN